MIEGVIEITHEELAEKLGLPRGSRIVGSYETGVRILGFCYEHPETDEEHQAMLKELEDIEQNPVSAESVRGILASGMIFDAQWTHEKVNRIILERQGIVINDPNDPARRK